MKKKDLKDKEYYHITRDKFKDEWIIKLDLSNPSNSELKGIFCKLIEGYRIGHNGWGDIRHCSKIRVATIAEKHHLDACIKAGIYVEPLKVDNYEMY